MANHSMVSWGPYSGVKSRVTPTTTHGVEVVLGQRGGEPWNGFERCHWNQANGAIRPLLQHGGSWHRRLEAPWHPPRLRNKGLRVIVLAQEGTAS